MNLWKTVFFICTFLPIFGFGQNTCFHKVYTFDDTLGIIANVYVNSDSSYLISASTGRFNRTSASIISLDKHGSIINKLTFKDTLRDESIGFGASKIYESSFDEFWFFYNSRLEGSWERYPKLVVFNQQNNTVTTAEIDTLTKMYFQTLDKSKLIVDEAADKYFITVNYNYFSSIDTTSSLPWDVGTFVLCYKMSTDSLIYIKRHNVSTTATTKPTRVMFNYLPYSSGKHLLIQREDFNNSNFSSQYAKVLFKTIDPTDGSIISTKQLHDTRWSTPGYGAALINNEKDLLISYTESDTLYTTTNPPQPYHAVRPTVARLDSNFNVVWKDTLRTYFSTTLACGGCIEKFAVQGDSSFTGAHTYIDIQNESQPSQSIYYSLRITNRNQQTGLPNWNRDYSFYPVVGDNYYANYDIHDVENTLDGGYIFAGESTNFDSLNANAPAQLGYVLKTNCLGFLDDPQAGFSATNNDSLGVQFQNGSLMGGSYLWSFGDGITLTTGENIDSIFHQYSDTGTFQVTLIAYGCNGVNDTITSSVHISKYNVPEPPINPNIVNYMALGPNPVQSGESIAVYVGNLPSENCWLAFYDYQGKLVLEHAIQQSKSTNIIVLPFEAGVYQAVLRNGDEELEVEKVLIY